MIHKSPVEGPTKRRPKWAVRAALGALAICGVAAMFPHVVVHNWLSGSHMEPNYRVGGRLFANRWAYAFSAPSRGDVVLFTHPDHDGLWEARVVGVAGDVISRRSGRFYRNDAEITASPVRQTFIVERGCDEPVGAYITIHTERAEVGKAYAVGLIHGSNSWYDFSGAVVPEGHLFLLPDYRDGGMGSDDYGPIPISRVAGKVFAFLRRLGPVSALPKEVCIN